MAEKILIVDDEEIIRGMLFYMLEKEGREITTATNAEEALELIVKEPFDLIITDNRMTGMYGKEMVRIIRTMPDRKDTPIIMVSGDDDITHKTCDVDDILLKPVRMDVVQAAVTKALARHRQST